MSDEPIPVIPLQYHQDGEHAPWLSVVRVLAVLCILAVGASSLFSAFHVWYYFERSTRSMYLRSGYSAGWMTYTVVVDLLVVIVNVIIIFCAVGCLRRNE